MTYTIKSIFHGDCHFVINNISNLNLILKLLIKDAVFDYQFGKKSKKSEFSNLYSFG